MEMNRRKFLLTAGAVGIGAVVTTSAVADEISETERIETPNLPPPRPRHTKHAVWPLQTDFDGMALLDPEAARKFAGGWKECKEPAELADPDDPADLERAFRNYLQTQRPRFAKTSTNGWVLDHELLGYDPRGRRWSYFEYDQFDGYEIFGREPAQMGYDPKDPHLCFHFTEEEAEKHAKHCQKNQFENRPEIHSV